MAENCNLFGEWKAYKSENFDGFLEKVGAPWIARKMAANATPTVQITKPSDNTVHVKQLGMMGGHESTFKVGEMSVHQPPNGPEMDTMTEWIDGKLTVFYIEKGQGDPKTSQKTNVRELLDNGEMLLTITWDDVVAKRWFKKVS